jgi:hypothetical protein
MNAHKNQYKKELMNWWNITNTEGCLSVNLTLKARSNGRMIDSITLSQNYRHFLNILSSKCFGSAFKRYGRLVKQINVFEKKSDLWHTHGIMKKPHHLTDQYFESLIIECWRKTNWGNKQYLCNWEIDKDWIGYITKLKGQSDHIDFLNFTWDC